MGGLENGDENWEFYISSPVFIGPAYPQIAKKTLHADCLNSANAQGTEIVKNVNDSSVTLILVLLDVDYLVKVAVIPNINVVIVTHFCTYRQYRIE